MIHKYRCETCNRKIGLPEGTDDCPIGVPSHGDVAIVYQIESVGCASHSDAKTIQCTVCGSEATHPHCDICFGLAMVNHRQDEREKVLDDLLQWRIEYMKTPGRGFAEYLAAEGRKLAKLRKQEQP